MIKIWFPKIDSRLTVLKANKIIYSPNTSPVVVTSGGAVVNNNVRRRKAEDKMAMIFIAIVSW